MARSQEPEPPASVRDAFAGEVFFKRIDMSLDALLWQERVLSSIAQDGFRGAAPLRSCSASAIVAVDAVLWHGADAALLDPCRATAGPRTASASPCGLITGFASRRLTEDDPVAATAVHLRVAEAVLAR